MKTIFVVALFLSGFALASFAQTTDNGNAQNVAPPATFHVWSDFFGGNQGAVVYPQYAWSVNTSAGNFSGFGFVEVAPREPFFTNNLVVYTPPQVAWFSVHTETGGVPFKGLSFFQIGPRINVTEVVPKLKKPMHHLFVAALPRFEGIRPNNLLVAGATNRFKLTNSIDWSIEGYRRFFPNHHDYAEYWLLVHPKEIPRMSFGTFILNDNKVSIGFGMRISFF